MLSCFLDPMVKPRGDNIITTHEIKDHSQ
ncbi:MAG: palindromic element RPE4 domain-containing protein [Rickettsia sp.]